MAWHYGLSRARVAHNTSRHKRRWSEHEIEIVATMLGHGHSIERIARYVQRSPRAVQGLQSRRPGLCHTKLEALTARAYAQEIGVSSQWVATLCRQGRLPARRVPGGRWWMIDPNWQKPDHGSSARVDDDGVDHTHDQRPSGNR